VAGLLVRAADGELCADGVAVGEGAAGDVAIVSVALTVAVATGTVEVAGAEQVAEKAGDASDRLSSAGDELVPLELHATANSESASRAPVNAGR
jgi:hypothetical protein